ALAGSQPKLPGTTRGSVPAGSAGNEVPIAAVVPPWPVGTVATSAPTRRVVARTAAIASQRRRRRIVRPAAAASPASKVLGGAGSAKRESSWSARFSTLNDTEYLPSYGLTGR